MLLYLPLIALRMLVGGHGMLIGAGGGFLLMPLLILLYPQERPEVLAGISLAVVCFNATSGSLGMLGRTRSTTARDGSLSPSGSRAPLPVLG